MRWVTGLASCSLEKIQENYQSSVIKKNCSTFGIGIPNDPSKYINLEDVQVLSPQSLLMKYDLKKIDLLEINAEGSDLQVIKIFDIKHTQPE